MKTLQSYFIDLYTLIHDPKNRCVREAHKRNKETLEDQYCLFGAIREVSGGKHQIYMDMCNTLRTICSDTEYKLISLWDSGNFEQNRIIRMIEILCIFNHSNISEMIKLMEKVTKPVDFEYRVQLLKNLIDKKY